MIISSATAYRRLHRRCDARTWRFKFLSGDRTTETTNQAKRQEAIPVRTQDSALHVFPFVITSVRPSRERWAESMTASTLKRPSDSQAHSTSVLLADPLLNCSRTFAAAQPRSTAHMLAAEVTLTNEQPWTTHCPAPFHRRQEYCT